jgi:hypothetical protein
MLQVVYIVIAAVVSLALLWLLEYVFKERHRQTEEIMLALTCVITNKELSRQARLDAYDEYKKLGGNGWVDGYVSGNLRIQEECAMGKHIIQIPSADGCVYAYDADRKTLQKICGIENPEDIPVDVLETLRIINAHIKTDKA